MFAVLGKDITFEIVGSPSSLRIARAYDYAMHKVVQAPPRLQWIANDLAELDLELTFHVRFTHPLAQLNAVYAAANDHLARALVFGNGVHRGYWVITNVEEKPGHLADDGSIISLAVNVTLQEWVLGAEVDPSAPPKPTTPPLAVVTVPTVPAAPLGVPGLGTAGAVPLAAPLTALLDPTSPIGRALGAYTVTTPLGGYSVPGFVAPGTSTLAGSMPTIPVGGAFGSVPAGQIVGAP